MESGELTTVYKTWDDGFSVRRMTSSDAKIVQQWYQAICPTSCDLQIALDVLGEEPGGFYIGEYNGEVVASAIRIPVSEGVFYGSCYYVDERFRGLGFGTRLRDDVAVKYVAGRSLAIDAHDELELMNVKRGYKKAFRVNMYSGKANKLSPSRKCHIAPISSVTFNDVMAYDDKCFIRSGSPIRREFMTKWIQIPGSASAVALNDSGNIIGYGCRRPCIENKSYIIGPLYADDHEIAMNIFAELVKDIIGHNVQINIREEHQAAVELMAAVELQPELHMIRMYLNGDPGLLSPTVYGLTSIDVCGF